MYARDNIEKQLFLEKKKNRSWNLVGKIGFNIHPLDYRNTNKSILGHVIILPRCVKKNLRKVQSKWVYCTYHELICQIYDLHFISDDLPWESSPYYYCDDTVQTDTMVMERYSYVAPFLLRWTIELLYTDVYLFPGICSKFCHLK